MFFDKHIIRQDFYRAPLRFNAKSHCEYAHILPTELKAIEAHRCKTNIPPFLSVPR